MFSFKKKTSHQFSLALVTGATSGIGKALCHLLANQKINLIITGRNACILANIQKELKNLVCVESLALDLSLSEERKKLVEKIYECTPDLVVNNAGFGLYGEALSFETDELINLISLNIEAVLELTLESSRALVAAKKRGTILNVSSAASLLAFPNFATYAASKAFVTNISQSLDYEMRPHGIKILVSCPGVVETNFRHRASGDLKDPYFSSYSSMTAEFAALQIWNQIIKQKGIQVFDWKTKIGLILANYFVPNSLLLKILSKKIDSLHSPRKVLIENKFKPNWRPKS